MKRKLSRLVSGGLSRSVGFAGNCFRKLLPLPDNKGRNDQSDTSVSEGEQKYRTIFENVHDVYYRTDIGYRAIARESE